MAKRNKRKCRYCGERRFADEMFITPLAAFCDRDHALKYANANKEKTAERLKADKIKKAKAQHKKDKESLKTAGDYTKEAQAAVNKYVRLRDHGKPCISCGSLPAQKLGGTMDAGHYRSRGAAGHLRFNLLNIHAQCVKCNLYKSGNAVDYRLNLIEKIGLDKVEGLENDNTSRKFTIEYLRRIKKIFNKKARLMQKRIDRATPL